MTRVSPHNDKFNTTGGHNMWLENLKELKKRSNKSTKQIIEGTMLPERTIVRIFSGETNSPTITTLIPIVNFLGGSLDEIFADTKVIVGDETLATLQDNVNTVTAENKILNDKVAALTHENEMLRMQISYKDEIIALHNYYNNLKPNK